MNIISIDQAQALIPGGIELDYPNGAHIQQLFTGPTVEDVTSRVREELERPEIARRIRPGQKIGLGVGSRGIQCLGEVVRATVTKLREYGAEPFIIPAMGSHGGATPEGQRMVLASYGITEEALGVPIEASMEVVELGKTGSGVPVHFSKAALQADGVVPIGRIKAHTAFRGPVESGLFKMLTIGFGKHKGAATAHSCGFDRFAELIPEVGRFILDRAPVSFGIAIVENAAEDAAAIEALTPEEMPKREPELLVKAKAWMGRILFDRFDVLVVDEAGKNISGDGMDPNVTGRFTQPFVQDGPEIQKIAVLDLTDESHGNACGIGSADVITQNFLDKIDFYQTYTNGVTSTVLSAVRLPVVMPTTQTAVALALRSCNAVEPGEERIVRIKNTLELDEIWVSDALLEETEGRKDVKVLDGSALVV